MNETQKVNLISVLIDLAYIDDNYDDKEENLIIKIVHSLNIDFAVYQNILDTSINRKSMFFSLFYKTL